MTDPSLSPDREEAVRRLLAEVGSDAPDLPADVAGRLDTSLAELTAARATPVIDLAAQRRRRVVSTVLVAAAAVVAVGVGAPLLQGDDGHRALSTATDHGADRPGDATALGESAPHLPTTTGRKPEPQAAPELNGMAADKPTSVLPVLHRTRLRADLLSLRRSLRGTATAYDEATIKAPHGFTCAPARFGRGQRVAVRYAGAPAVVVFRAPTASTQVAEVLQCGTAKVLGSVTLPPPR